MEQEDFFCYAPFNRYSNFPLRNQSLLLQFVLMALVHEVVEGSSCSAAMNEHVRLFPYAFPDMDASIQDFAGFIKRVGTVPLSPHLRREGFRKLNPFFFISKTDESLWLFLVKQGHHLDAPKNIISLLQALYSEDLSTVSLRMAAQFSARGFSVAGKECISHFYTLNNHV